RVAGEQSRTRGGFGNANPPIATPRDAELLGREHLLLLTDELGDGRAPEDKGEHTRQHISSQDHRRAALVKTRTETAVSRTAKSPTTPMLSAAISGALDIRQTLCRPELSPSRP